MIEPMPVPRQFVPVQEHHEIGQIRIAVLAARADLPHQVHAHGIAAEREKRAVTERENAGEAPDQVDRHGQQGVAEKLAEQGDGVGGDMPDAVGWREQIGGRDDDQHQQDGAHDHEPHGRSVACV